MEGIEEVGYRVVAVVVVVVVVVDVYCLIPCFCFVFAFICVFCSAVSVRTGRMHCRRLSCQILSVHF